MIKKLLNKFWNLSPKTIFNFLKSKITFSIIKPQWTEVKSGPLKGGKLFVSGDSFVGWMEMINGSFDSFIYNEVESCCSIKGAVFWDIGAHFGYHSLSFASLVGKHGHVYSFEPNPFNISRFRLHLEKNFELANCISLEPFALSDVSGEISFIFSEDVDGSSSSGSHLQNVSTPLKPAAYNKFKTQIVRTFTIDDFIKNTNPRIPNIIKIDVEGAELLILKGGKEFFKKNKPVLFIEIHNILMMFYVTDFLYKIGYSIRVLDEANSTLSKCYIIAQLI